MPRTEIELPEDVTAVVEGTDLIVEGPNGRVEKRLWYPGIDVSVDGGTVVVAADAEDRKTTATVGTFTSHVENLVQGVTEGWTYEMAILYAHFPMQVRVEGDEVVIENFLGERHPRRTAIHGATEVEVDGELIRLTGPDKEAVGQTAADIEQLTRVANKDTRVFQDGVYITKKSGKEVV